MKFVGRLFKKNVCMNLQNMFKGSKHISNTNQIPIP